MNNLLSNKKTLCVCGIECQCNPCICSSQSKALVLAYTSCDPCNCGLSCICETLKKSKVDIKSVGCCSKRVCEKISGTTESL